MSDDRIDGVQYLSGYSTSVQQNDADINNGSQMSNLKTFVSRALMKSNKSIIVDIGMGRGIIAKVLKDCLAENFVYIGVDIDFEEENIVESGLNIDYLTKGICRFIEFYKLNDIFETSDYNSCDNVLIILKNTFHELRAGELVSLLFCFEKISREKKLDVFIQEHEKLDIAKFGVFPWSSTDLSGLFGSLKYKFNIISHENRSRNSTYYFIIDDKIEQINERDISQIVYKYQVKKYERYKLQAKELFKQNNYKLPTLELLTLQNDIFALDIQISELENEIYDRIAFDLKQEKGKVIPVSWQEVIDGINNFLKDNDCHYDYIISAELLGVPIAATIARKQKDSIIGVIQKKYKGCEFTPFFVFENEDFYRSDREKIIKNISIPISRTEKRMENVLIVDAVTTFGNTLEFARQIVLKKMGNDIRIDMYVHALDKMRLSVAKKDMCKNIKYTRNIDNHKVWLSFPWEDILNEIK